MPIITAATVNPTTTSAVYGPGFRGPGGGDGTYKSEAVAVAVSTAITIPFAVETYPATFYVCTGGERTLNVCGTVTVLAAAKVSVPTSVGFSAAASSTADHVVVSAAAGKLVLTNATTAAATAVTNWYVTRIA
jgi:hypothetical protein